MEHAAPDEKPAALKPVNWYSGWRLFATAAATVVSAKLIGILGSLVAGLLFFWLQPKRGTWQALAAAAVVGGVVAVAYSAFVLPQLVDQRATPSKQIDWEKGVFTPPPSSAADTRWLDGVSTVIAPTTPTTGQVSPNNPFADPNYGKELLQNKP